MSKHTPLPFKADGTHICQNNNGRLHVIGEVKLWTDFDDIDFKNKQRTDYGKHWLVDMSYPIEGTKEDYAKLIACACNSHYDLLKVLKNLQAALIKNTDDMPDWLSLLLTPAMDDADEAIAKAEGDAQ